MNLLFFDRQTGHPAGLFYLCSGRFGGNMSLFGRLQPESSCHLEREWDRTTSWLQLVCNISAWRANCCSEWPHGRTSDSDLFCCQHTWKWLPAAVAACWWRRWFRFNSLFAPQMEISNMCNTMCINEHENITVLEHRLISHQLYPCHTTLFISVLYILTYMNVSASIYIFTYNTLHYMSLALHILYFIISTAYLITSNN